MSGATDDDDYWVPPGTKIVMSYGPDGPSPQPVDGDLCARVTRERNADELEAALAAERLVYQESLAKSGRGSIPSLQHRNVLAEGTARGTPRDTRSSALPPLPVIPKLPPLDPVIELSVADLMQEDE